ncbi:DNA cross-link repair protein SNM1 [Dioscorea cayenensis subsp. rotundata]|uniref:DNA cross-link repair protein SNM1 n=1 Tax=Dioscorea cayennensis subsp. rotundata TaxID=55577 RepID=A0AB40BZR4_DIOCR|nr:DNA cross-link repair protein SNM1 [Dioscorea cayenensis subsp. rotundata]
MESETLALDLDDNGFPIDSLSSEEEPVDRDSEKVEERGLVIPSAVQNTGSFALDFYAGGTDWSCLISKEKCSGNKGLVQKNLFQAWGIEKPSLIPSRSSISFSPPRKRHCSKRIAEDRSGTERPRICPFYKKIPGTSFAVDAFRYGLIQGCSGYFLTHFHYDHYGGLSKRWSHGPIYCSPLTARLVKMCLSVNPLFICPLELDTEHLIDGVKVTMLEANHCPGAALVHFRLKDGRCYLHTGDFRACKMMQSYALLTSQRINVLYLDTTYCNPKYRFPPKEDVVNFVVRTTRKYLEKQPKTLVVVGSYSIGKEHVYVTISQALGVQIYTDPSRRRILQSFGWPQLCGQLCSSGQTSPLHVLPLSVLRPESLKEYLKKYSPQFTAVLAFRPTGWTYSEATGNHLDLIKPTSKGNITIYGVPYSEHSNYEELREFVKFLRPERIIPTVNVGNAANRDKMQSYFQEWLKT